MKQLTLEKLEGIFKNEVRASLATTFLDVPDFYRVGAGCVMASMCGMTAKIALEIGIFENREESWSHFIALSEQILKETAPIFNVLGGAYEAGYFTSTKPGIKEARRKLRELGLELESSGEDEVGTE